MDVPGALKIRNKVVDLLELCPTNAERLWIIRSLFLWAAQRDVIEKAAYTAPEALNARTCIHGRPLSVCAVCVPALEKLRLDDDDVAVDRNQEQREKDHGPIVPPGEGEVAGS